MKRYRVMLKGLRMSDTPARVFGLMSFRHIPMRGDYIEIDDSEVAEFERLARLPGVLSGLFTVNSASGYFLDYADFDNGSIIVSLKERKIQPDIKTAQKAPGKPVVEITFPRADDDTCTLADIVIVQTFGESSSRTVFADVPLAKDDSGRWKCRVEAAIFPDVEVWIEIGVPPRFRMKADENSLFSRMTADGTDPQSIVPLIEKCRRVLSFSEAIYLSEKWYYFRIAAVAVAALILMIMGGILTYYITN